MLVPRVSALERVHCISIQQQYNIFTMILFQYDLYRLKRQLYTKQLISTKLGFNLPKFGQIENIININLLYFLKIEARQRFLGKIYERETQTRAFLPIVSTSTPFDVNFVQRRTLIIDFPDLHTYIHT